MVIKLRGSNMLEKALKDCQINIDKKMPDALLKESRKINVFDSLRESVKRLAAAVKESQVKKTRKPTTAERMAESTTWSWMHNDSRVITRERDVALYDLRATEEHIAGLLESLAAVRRKKATLEAHVAGLTKVLERRA